MRQSMFILTFIMITISAIGQSVYYPHIDHKSQKDVYIKEVYTTEYFTQITFIYKNSGSNGHYIFLSLPGSPDAYYIKTNDRKYKLLSTQNIGNADKITVAMPGEAVEFSARFEKLPSYITRFDLIEGVSGTWDFYGVQISETNSDDDANKKFRIDYNYIAAYDPSTDTWSEWREGDNTFVININSKGDIAHLKANGETVVYKRLSGVEEGYTKEGNHHYQVIKALDEDGDVFHFQLFDDPSVGLKMMWGSFIIQFSRL